MPHCEAELPKNIFFGESAKKAALRPWMAQKKITKFKDKKSSLLTGTKPDCGIDFAYLKTINV